MNRTLALLAFDMNAGRKSISLKFVMFSFKRQPTRRRVFSLLVCISVLFSGCATHRKPQSDFYFLPCKAQASVSFEGETQAGPGIHRPAIRSPAYRPPNPAEHQVLWQSCVIYY